MSGEAPFVSCHGHGISLPAEAPPITNTTSQTWLQKKLHDFILVQAKSSLREWKKWKDNWWQLLKLIFYHVLRKICYQTHDKDKIVIYEMVWFTGINPKGLEKGSESSEAHIVPIQDQPICRYTGKSHKGDLYGRWNKTRSGFHDMAYAYLVKEEVFLGQWIPGVIPTLNPNK